LPYYLQKIDVFYRFEEKRKEALKELEEVKKLRMLAIQVGSCLLPLVVPFMASAFIYKNFLCFRFLGHLITFFQKSFSA
jgi:hypothetical protein